MIKPFLLKSWLPFCSTAASEGVTCQQSYRWREPFSCTDASAFIWAKSRVSFGLHCICILSTTVMDMHSAVVVSGERAPRCWRVSSSAQTAPGEGDGRQCPGQQKLTGDCDICSSPREKGAKMEQKYGHYKNAFYLDFRHV